MANTLEEDAAELNRMLADGEIDLSTFINTDIIMALNHYTAKRDGIEPQPLQETVRFIQDYQEGRLSRSK